MLFHQIHAKKLAVLAALAGGFLLLLNFSFRQHQVDYNVEVKPILNKHCLACHGGVKRKGGFSLLTREDALAPTESKHPAIVPGDPAASEFIRRLKLDDPEERMPLEKPSLTTKEIEVLEKWVAQGANWEVHWAYRPIEKPSVPGPIGFWAWLGLGGEADRATNPVDRFIQAKAREKGLSSAPPADKASLLRRVSLDLIGMPAPDALAQQFLNNDSPLAYEQLIDSLLGLPQFGERWTALWLDLARYADTKGYERDDRRHIWRYRDWLIRAFNSDLPYDQFLTQQLAGDLLAGKDVTNEAAFVATAFHRNTMTNDEGGTDNEEFRTAAVIDRVNTTWEALMGTTFACVQCHDHPYDPFRHEEYYRFMALFNNSRDADTEEDYPLLRHFSASDSTKLDVFTQKLSAHLSPEEVQDIRFFLKTWQPVRYSLETDSYKNAALYDTKWLGLRHKGESRLPNVDLTGKNRLLVKVMGWAAGGAWSVRLDSLNGPVLFTTSLPKTDYKFIFKTLTFKPVAGRHDLFFYYENPSLKPDFAGMQFDWFYFTDEKQLGFDGSAALQQTFHELLEAKAETTPVMVENPESMHRETHQFERGNWLVKGKRVEPGVPAHLPLKPGGQPNNRLELAKWMTAPENPLVARTMVNRLWEQLFGSGLAETLEDLGSQGISPTHPELLDWLSYHFIHEDQWSMKKLLKRMVLSATYQQDSKVTPEALQADPYNKWLARGPRVRLTAEQVRDQALCIAGVLSGKMYGPSVMPDQPPGLWQSPWNGDDWKISEGEDRFRRAIYTFWKRTSPYPATMNFDGAARDVCVARRVRTNTPLQALVTLNDEAYMMASRHFAQRIMASASDQTLQSQIQTAYLLATGRPPTTGKAAVLEKFYEKALAALKKQPHQADQIIGTVCFEGDTVEAAALVMVANAVLNLDEVLTKS